MLPDGVAVGAVGVFVAATGVSVAVGELVAMGVFVAGAVFVAVAELVEAGVFVATVAQRAVPVRWSALHENDKYEPLAQRTVSPLASE